MLNTINNTSRLALKKYYRTKKNIKRLYYFINSTKFNDPYHYSDESRKSNLLIWADNLLWLIKHGEINFFYFLSGMHLRDKSLHQEVLAYTEFSRIRDKKNLSPKSLNYNYVSILRDKFIFSQLLKSLNIPTPTNIALLNSKGITWLSDMSYTPLEYLSLAIDLEINGFCKELAGMHGKGAFLLKISNGKLLIKNELITIDHLQKLVKGQFLLQTLIVQHPKLNELHPASVNTIRVITFNNNGKIEILCAALRIGTSGNHTDNWTTGAIAVNIDTDTGKLTGKGVFKPGYGGKITSHPDSGILLEGFEVPYFKEGIQLVCRLHSYLYGIHSAGWDFAITPDGPIIIEGNDSWGNGIPTALYRDFKSKVMRFYSK